MSPINIKFDNVAREILGGYHGIAGSLPNTLSEGSTYTYQYTHTLASNYDENNIKIVGMIIHHSTGEIVNAIKVDLDISTNIASNNENQDFIIYPNPTKNKILIDGKYDTLEIYNFLGKMLIKSTNKKTIDVSHLKNGIYTIKIQYNNTNKSKNFIIAR